jgi:5,10-methenyltetrahydrofolate synthetase
MDDEPADLAAWRAATRADLLARRAAVAVAERRALDARVTDLLAAAFFTPLGGRMLGFYWPMKGEFDPRVAVLRLRERGARAALPAVVRKAAPLEFREWWPDVDTQPGVFGLPVPQGTPIVVPEACLIPPVGFDARGYRLGYGGGYFDRTLAALSPQPLKIAVARESNRIPTIHPQAYDIPMDFIVTEAGIESVTAAGLERVDAGEAARRASRILAR